jgi:hypothetical protein
MTINFSYTRHVKAHEKSVVLGGAIVLYPVEPSVTQAFARQIRMAIERAEDAAYRQGQEDARREMRQALGLPE